MIAHASFGAQTSSHTSLLAHTSAHTIFGAHTSDCMRFLPRAPTSVALLITDLANSNLFQTQHICSPPLYIVISSKPMIQLQIFFWIFFNNEDW